VADGHRRQHARLVAAYLHSVVRITVSVSE